MNGVAQNLLTVGCGGFVGAIVRYGLTGLLQKKFPQFTPAGTLAVNVLGCLIIGGLMAAVTLRPNFPPSLRLFLVTGLLGSLTTFSTFGYETVELLREEDYRKAAWNVAANLLLGLPAVWLGWTATQGWLR
jgi:fluoride exporter